MSRKQLEGLVLECTPYRERDGLVALATPEGVIRILARGIQKETSRNRRICLPFTRVQIETEQQGEGMHRLIHGTLLEDCGVISEDLRMQAVCLAVNEAVIRSGMPAGLYARLEALWFSCRQKNPDWLGRAAVTAALILQAEGIAPQVDGCAICGSQSQICSMDLESAGFLCRRHARGRPVWKPERLRRMRQAVKVPPGLENRLDLTGFTLADVRLLLTWYSRYGHSPLNSVRFLDLVVPMYPEPEDSAQTESARENHKNTGNN
ncbi:DNA repair protein RecO [uncultured Faecalibaculum sp.]|uniref:DNA repair protein RecO n=1 Tax=uncultured Faecalibaculum sp. TaxID=1729681 RepID=UPI00261F587E|nr:DNA repair protein RecO [uncultured Faecalibaculum sp.]